MGNDFYAPTLKGEDMGDLDLPLSVQSSICPYMHNLYKGVTVFVQLDHFVAHFVQLTF